VEIHQARLEMELERGGYQESCPLVVLL
jgi:hypothetical protein